LYPSPNLGAHPIKFQSIQINFGK